MFLVDLMSTLLLFILGLLKNMSSFVSIYIMKIHASYMSSTDCTSVFQVKSGSFIQSVGLRFLFPSTVCQSVHLQFDLLGH